MKKRYVNIKELSEYVSLPIKTLYEWASQGRVPSIKWGRRVLFDKEDIDKLLQSKKCDASRTDETSDKIVGEINNNDYNA